MICLRERQIRFSSSTCWPKLRVARISDYSLSTSVLHLCTLEQMRIFMRLRAAVNGTRKASEALERVLMRQARDKNAFAT